MMHKKYHVDNGVFFKEFDDEQAAQMFVRRQESPSNWAIYVRLDPEDNDPVTPEWLDATFRKGCPGTWDFDGGWLALVGDSCHVCPQYGDTVGFVSKRGQLLRLVKALGELSRSLDERYVPRTDSL